MDLAKQCGSFVANIDSVVDHAEGKLYDNEDYDQDADDLMCGVEVFGLCGVSAVDVREIQSDDLWKDSSKRAVFSSRLTWLYSIPR